MIVLTTSAAQTIAVGAAINFDVTKLNTGCSRCNRGTSAKLTTRGNHMITFTGNIGATTATTAAQVTIYDNGSPISSPIIHMTEAAGDINNVSAPVPVNNCCGDFGTISVINTGTTTLNVGAGATLVIQ